MNTQVGTVLELSHKLNKRLPQTGHDIRRIMLRKSANQVDGNNPICEFLVVDCDEQRPDVFSLREMLIELLLERHQHRLSYRCIFRTQ